MSNRADQRQIENLSQMLAPPGSGILNPSPPSASVQQESLAWQETLNRLPQSAPTTPLLLGIPSDSGGGLHGGSNHGPQAIRSQLALTKESVPCIDLGDVKVVPQLLDDQLLNATTIARVQTALYNNPHSSLPVSPLSITAEVSAELQRLLPNRPLLALGGDHSISYPLIANYLKHKKGQGKKIAVIQFDAHTDLLSDRFGLDITFGSWASHIIPLLAHPSHLIQIGLRHSSLTPTQWQQRLGVTQIWCDQIFEQGVVAIAKQLNQLLSQERIDEIYLTFDIDALDPSYAPATGTPVAQGLSLEQPIIILNALANNYPIGGADLVEVAPYIDWSGDGNGYQTTLLSASTIAKQLLLILSNGVRRSTTGD
ncbi:MAG: arginase family protein [Bdellovibrionales bacterium]|jgi:agmatinase|nr:arginase family protein [Bdellovibrionales bacterium]MBT3525059.1 arginase family protein [Bdellovibrionales bacterium]MBT7767420.1 arginase family protein [Bdellovibrionales bacterium]